MDVKIVKTCGRCNKTQEETVPLEEAQQLDADSKAAEVAAGEVEHLINEVLTEAHPPVVISIWTGSGYKTRTLSDLCDGTRGCAGRVETLVKEIFLENPKPKKKKAPQVTEAPVEAGSEVTE